MSTRIKIDQGEQGRLWVFAVDLEGSALAAFTRRNGRWPLQEALGAEWLDPEHVEVFDTSDLDGVGLAGYLREGHGVPAAQIDPIRARLDAQKGAVMVLSSRAVRGAAQTLTPRAPLRLLASLSEERPPVRFEPLPSEAAIGAIPESAAKPPRSAAAQSGLVALAALVVLFALVAVMLWIAA